MKKTTGKLVEIAGKQHYLSVGKVHHGQHLGKYQLSWLPSGPPSPRWIWYLLKVSWPLLAPGSVLRPLGHVLQQDLPALGKKGETSPVGTSGFAQVQFRPSVFPPKTLLSPPVSLEWPTSPDPTSFRAWARSEFYFGASLTLQIVTEVIARTGWKIYFTCFFLPQIAVIFKLELFVGNGTVLTDFPVYEKFVNLLKLFPFF